MTLPQRCADAADLWCLICQLLKSCGALTPGRPSPRVSLPSELATNHRTPVIPGRGTRNAMMAGIIWDQLGSAQEFIVDNRWLKAQSVAQLCPANEQLSGRSQLHKSPATCKDRWPWLSQQSRLSGEEKFEIIRSPPSLLSVSSLLVPRCTTLIGKDSLHPRNG